MKALSHDLNGYVTSSMCASDALEPYSILKKAKLKRWDRTDRQTLDQLFHNMDLQHGSATEMLHYMGEVIGQRTFGKSLSKQLFLFKPLQNAQLVLVSFQNNTVINWLHLPIEC